MLKVKDTVIKKETGTPIVKIATPGTATAADAANKVNELIDKLKAQDILV